MEIMQSGTWFSMAQYAFIVAITAGSSATICFALHLLRRLKRQRNFECSPSLLVYLLCLLLCSMALSGQYAFLLLFSLLPSAADVPPANTQLIFWSGLFPGSLIPATPISVLFLSLDRLLIVLLPSIYMRKPTKLGLAAASALSVFALFAMSFCVNFAQRPTEEMPQCISFGCLTSDASRLIYVVNRLVVALPNFLAGAAFLAVLFAYRRRMDKNAGPNQGNSASRSRKMADRLALWVVIFEFALDLLPNMANFLLTTLFAINVSVYVGAFRSLSYSLCALCSSLAHTAVLWRIFASKTTPSVTKSGIQTAAGKTQTRRIGQSVVMVADSHGEGEGDGGTRGRRGGWGGGGGVRSAAINGGRELARMDGPRRITFAG